MEEVNRLDINLSQLQRNYQIIKAMLKPGVKFMAVVKGNAYGHGLVPIAKALEAFGCDCLGVVRIMEAIALREAGIKIPIIMLAPIMPSQIELILEHEINIMVDNENTAWILNERAKAMDKTANIHIKINTGLNRYGVEAENAVALIKRIVERCSKLKLEGLYTHFRSPEFNKPFTDMQIEKLKAVVEELGKEGLRPPLVHADATGGILMYPDAQFDMVRCGILLYGEEYIKSRKMLPEGLKSLMTLKSHITKIIEVRAGDHVGYGDKFTAGRSSKIAVIGIGYGDGVSRGWKEVLIHGQKVPVVNYSMDGLEVNITNINDSIKEFDEVVIVGRQGDQQITWEEVCYWLNTELDEQLQRITERVPRYYFYE